MTWLNARGIAQLLTFAAPLIVGACATDSPPTAPTSTGDATLAARPTPAPDTLQAGRYDLNMSGPRDGFIYIPNGLEAGQSAPLLVLLHGATGDADNWEGAFSLADSLGVVFLAPDSRSQTWDLIAFRSFGVDVAFIDAALEETFRQVTVDPTRIGLAGFSDGASYALSLGLSNGDLFTHVVAWSPGFSAPAGEVGQPEVFVSHGTQDGILSVQTTRDLIVPTLQQAGYSVRYEEFVGGHEIPATISRQAFDWFLN